MSKKLNITSITNELTGGSAFFPSKRPATGSPAPLPPIEAKNVEPIITRSEPKQQVPERPNDTAPVRPNGKRIITRNSFETYEDQMDSLRKLSYREKMDGKLGSMSAMVREAIDDYLKKKRAT